MTLFRWLLGMPAAALVTAALFFMMAEMIKNRNVKTNPPKPPLELNINADDPIENEFKFKKPKKLPDNIPETEIEFPKPTGNPGGITIDPIPGEKIDTTSTGAGDGDFGGYSIIIAPPYPENCRSKGAEGIVVVKYDVTPQGDVTNIQIVKSPDRCFDRPIRNAVSKWKFAPSAENGRQVARRGLTETFNFQLVDQHP